MPDTQNHFHSISPRCTSRSWPGSSQSHSSNWAEARCPYGDVQVSVPPPSASTASTQRALCTPCAQRPRLGNSSHVLTQTNGGGKYYVHIHFSPKQEEIPPFVTTQMEVEDIPPNEISETQREKYQRMSLYAEHKLVRLTGAEGRG